MPEIKFTCPSCNQDIQGDESYCGAQINCPTCNTLLVVPQNPIRARKQARQITIVPIFISILIFVGALAFVTVTNNAIDKWYYKGMTTKTLTRQQPDTKTENTFSPQLSRVTVYGTLYVKLRSGENVRLSQVTIAAYDEHSLSNGMAFVNGIIKYNTEDEQSRLQAIKRLMMGNLNNGLDGSLWGGATTLAQTDIDGKFQIKLPHVGAFAFFAYTKRQTPFGTEPYLFFQRILFRGAGDYTIEINNNDEKISDYTSDWVDEYKTEKFNERSDLDWQKDILYWIMKGSYGLADVQTKK
jgi:hypothetical protein